MGWLEVAPRVTRCHSSGYGLDTRVLGSSRPVAGGCCRAMGASGGVCAPEPPLLAGTHCRASLCRSLPDLPCGAGGAGTQGLFPVFCTCYLFIFTLFERKKDRPRSPICHVHSLNACNSQDWSRPKPGACVAGWVAGTQLPEPSPAAPQGAHQQEAGLQAQELRLPFGVQASQAVSTSAPSARLPVGPQL